MSLRMTWLPLVAALMLSLGTATARANSITTYGIIVTAMGNDLQVEYVDKPTKDGGNTDTTLPPVVDTGDKSGSLLVTSNGAGGISITPYNGNSTTEPSQPGTGSSSSGDGGTVDGGTVDGVKDGGSVDVPPEVIIFPEPTVTEDGSSNAVVDDNVEPPIQTAGPGPAAQTPEPASLTLLALAGLGGLYARRRRV